MKKQRSKSELLKALRTYKAVQKDYSRHENDRVCGTASYWRTGVEWAYVLWKLERLSTNDISNMIQYVNANIEDMTEEHRGKINKMMEHCDWYLVNTSKKKKCKNAIDQTCNDIDYYNAEMCVDYSLLVCEWLITNKHFGHKRLDRDLVEIFRIDLSSLTFIFGLRDELYKKKKIWLELNKQDSEDYFDANQEDVNIITL